MAQLIDPTEIFYTSFEPKLQNRFILYANGIPSFICKKMNRPQIEFGEVVLDHINILRKVKGKGRWGDINITLYDPIVPSGAQAVMEWIRTSHESATGRDGYSDFYKKDLVMNILGPVGDKVEEWTLKGAWIKSLQMGDMDWAVDQHVEINMTLAVDYCILKY